jgi:tetratricopeptide (TPR) repeat protein
MTTSDVKAQAANAIRVYQEGDYQNAAHLFGEVASLYQVQGNDLDAAEMMNNQSVALLQDGDAQGSFDAAHGTAQVFLANGDFRRQGMALGNEASALTALGRIDEAAESYRLAAEALETAGEDQLRASVMQALAGIQLRKGKILEALLSMQLGLAGLKQPTFKQKILRGLLRLRA